jgi:hypothetical protein
MAQYPSPYSSQSLPQPQMSGGYPQPQMSGGYPQPQMSGGYPQPQMSGGYPQPQMSGGYPQPQMPVGHSQSQMPVVVSQQAISYQLGAFVKVHPANLVKLFFWAGLALLVTVLTIPVGLADHTGTLGLIILIAVTLYFLWDLVTNFNLKAYIFAEGIVRVKGSKVDVMRWEHIEALWVKVVRHSYRGLITIYKSYTYTVRRNDGVQFKFGSAFKNARQLGEVMQSEVARRHLPKAIAAYESGNPVQFGPLSVSMQGISKNGILVPWQQVGQVNGSRGWVVVHKQGSLLAGSRTRGTSIPNLQVFFQLVEHARRRSNNSY